MRAKVTVCAPRPPVRAAASARASRILWSSARVSSTVPRVSPSSAPASLWRTPGGRMQWNGLRTHIDPRRDPTHIATAESTSLIDQRGFELPPDARTAPRREMARVLRQSGGAQLALRRAHVVFELEEARGAAVEVDHERARQRLALARLATLPAFRSHRWPPRASSASSTAPSPPSWPNARGRCVWPRT